MRGTHTIPTVLELLDNEEVAAAVIVNFIMITFVPPSLPEREKPVPAPAGKEEKQGKQSAWRLAGCLPSEEQQRKVSQTTEQNKSTKQTSEV